MAQEGEELPVTGSMLYEGARALSAYPGAVRYVERAKVPSLLKDVYRAMTRAARDAQTLDTV